MKSIFSLLLLPCLLVCAPQAQAQQAPSSPYQTNWKVDVPVTVGLTAISAFGIYRNLQKDGLTQAEAFALRKEDVPRFDRFVAGKYDENARSVSDMLLGAAIIIPPGLVVLDPTLRQKTGQLAGLYVETMALSGAFFTTAVGNVRRFRPLTYSDKASITQRTRKNATNSFYAGHTAAAAAATFFAAKVYHDFHLDSPARKFVWAGAALVPAAVGYYRIQAGKHFLSDNVLGYSVGAAVGIIVPQLHKTAARVGVSCNPVSGYTPNGYAYGGLQLTREL